MSDLGPGDRQRLQPETKYLRGRGSMAPFSARREGNDDDPPLPPPLRNSSRFPFVRKYATKKRRDLQKDHLMGLK